MSVNRHKPHILVLPEDDANRQMAKGFETSLPQSATRAFQVLQEAGGWRKVLECFESEHVGLMMANQHRYMVLMIDFDGQQARFGEAQAIIPANLRDRVFVLGARTEPEDLRADLGTFETIGEALARDCRDGTASTWGHADLQHNTAEITRMRDTVRPILFP